MNEGRRLLSPLLEDALETVLGEKSERENGNEDEKRVGDLSDAPPDHEVSKEAIERFFASADSVEKGLQRQNLLLDELRAGMERTERRDAEQSLPKGSTLSVEAQKSFHWMRTPRINPVHEVSVRTFWFRCLQRWGSTLIRPHMKYALFPNAPLENRITLSWEYERNRLVLHFYADGSRGIDRCFRQRTPRVPREAFTKDDIHLVDKIDLVREDKIHQEDVLEDLVLFVK